MYSIFTEGGIVDALEEATHTSVYSLLLELPVTVEVELHILGEGSRARHVEEADTPLLGGTELEVSVVILLVKLPPGPNAQLVLVDLVQDGFPDGNFLRDGHCLSDDRVSSDLVQGHGSTETGVTPSEAHGLVLPRPHGHVSLSHGIIGTIADTPADSKHACADEVLGRCDSRIDFQGAHTSSVCADSVHTTEGPSVTLRSFTASILSVDGSELIARLA